MIPVYEPWVTPEDAQAVASATLSGWLAAGPAVSSLEERFAATCGAREGVAVSNGTVALELALRALRIGPGDEVVCPSLTIISCALAIERVGATPVLVDVDPASWTLTRAHVEEALGPRTRAVLGVHLFGHPFEPAIRQLASERGIALVEDAAEAHGSELFDGTRWTPCGSLGDVSTFSFYANKAITCGEGGMCLTRDPELAARLRSLRNLCFVPERRFLHHELGLNARLGNLPAALALSQLARLEIIVAHKRRVYAAYRERLAELGEVTLQAVELWARPVPWMASLVLDEGAAPADSIIAKLGERGIEARPFFLGLHEQPALAHHPRRSLPATERLARRGLYLPSSPRLDEHTIDLVCDALRGALRGSPKAGASGAGASGIGPAPSSPARTGLEPGAAPFQDEYAGLYDLFYADKAYDVEARALLALARSLGVEPRSLLDLGCGSGRHLAALDESGLELAGCDPSAAMLALARGRLPRAELVQARASTARLARRFDLVTMLFAVLSYVVDDDELAATLRNVRAHLAPGGLFLAEVWYGPAVLREPPEDREATVTVGSARYRRRATTRHDPLRQQARVTYEIEKSAASGAERVTSETHALRYFFPRELASLVRDAGLELVTLGSYPEGAPLPAEPRSYSALLVARAA